MTPRAFRRLAQRAAKEYSAPSGPIPNATKASISRIVRSVELPPSPYGNYLEDRQSIGLSVTGTLNNNLRLGASWSAFFGGHVNNIAKDTDFASLTASYTF